MSSLISTPTSCRELSSSHHHGPWTRNLRCPNQTSSSVFQNEHPRCLQANPIWTSKSWDDFLHPGNFSQLKPEHDLYSKGKIIWTKPSLFNMLNFQRCSSYVSHSHWQFHPWCFSSLRFTGFKPPKLRMLRGFVILCRCDGHILKTWSKPPWKRSPGMSRQTANFRPFSWEFLRVMEVDGDF